MYRPHSIAGELLLTDRTGLATAVFPQTIKFPIIKFHIILYICKYPCVIICHQQRFEGSSLPWQQSWDRAPVFSEWPSGGDTSRMSISRLRTTTWNSKLSWPKSRDWGDPKMSYNRGCLQRINVTFADRAGAKEAAIDDEGPSCEMACLVAQQLRHSDYMSKSKKTLFQVGQSKTIH